MKIIYCLQGLKRTGGIERVTTTKANYWTEQGHEVHIITTDQGDAPLAFQLDERVQHHDIGMDYEQDNRLGRWERMRALRAKRTIHRDRLSSLLCAIRADIVVSTFFQEAPILPTIQDGSKKILELHSSMYRRVFMYPASARLLRLYGYYRIWQDKRLARQYDRFVVLTHEDRGYWGEIPGIETIPNPLPFTTDTPSECLSPRVLAVGRYEYEKNFSTLIDLWAGIASRHPEWTLEILGDGPLRPQLEAQVHTLGLEGRVLLSRFDTDVQAHYRSASAITLLSEYEGLPMVLLEAQAMGLPIVAYTCKTGPRDIVTDASDGYLVPAGDASALAERLEYLITNPTQRIAFGKAAQASAQRFALPTIMHRWTTLFQSLLR